MAFASFPDNGKPRTVSKQLKKIMAARARGEFKPVYDWLPEHMRKAKDWHAWHDKQEARRLETLEYERVINEAASALRGAQIDIAEGN